MSLLSNQENKSYSSSYLSITPAPEYVMPEAVLASTLRNLFLDVSEGDVIKKNARNEDLMNRILDKIVYVKSSFQIDFLNYLSVPSPTNRYKKNDDYYGWVPFVPKLSSISTAVRPSGSNPWNPGKLYLQALKYISVTKNEYHDLINLSREVFSDKGDYDPTCKILNKLFDDLDEFVLNNYDNISDDVTVFGELRDIKGASFPVLSLKVYLNKLLTVKEKVTVRQWISIIESFLRLLLTSHVRWLMWQNTVAWNEIRKRLKDNSYSSTLTEYSKEYLSGFIYKERLTPQIQNEISNYICARIGINLALNKFSESEVELKNILEFENWINNLNVSESEAQDFNHEFEVEKKNEIRKISCSTGIGRNLHFFVKYLLGQRKVVNDEDKNYDQGYWAVKRGKANNAPWHIDIGPVSTILTSILSTEGGLGSAIEVSRFFNKMGIKIHADAIPGSKIGKSFSELGITNDSPDGERGFVIKNPFKIIA